jgi:hypothetical protein
MAKGIIFKKPETAKELSNPEVLIQGYGRMNLDTLKKKIAKDHDDATRLLKSNNFESYQYVMNNISEFVEAVLDVQAELDSPRYKRMRKKLGEEPVNNVGGGKIAGLGVGPQGEPGLTRAQQRRYKRRNQKDIRNFINILTKP